MRHRGSVKGVVAGLLLMAASVSWSPTAHGDRGYFTFTLADDDCVGVGARLGPRRAGEKTTRGVRVRPTVRHCRPGERAIVCASEDGKHVQEFVIVEHTRASLHLRNREIDRTGRNGETVHIDKATRRFTRLQHNQTLRGANEIGATVCEGEARKEW